MINYNCPLALLAGTAIKVNSPYAISHSPYGSEIGYEIIEGEIKNACFSRGKLLFFTLNHYYSQSYTLENII